MSTAWIRQLTETLQDGPCVLVTLRQHKGSAPRESGARMIVGQKGLQGSIGGGNLEHQAIATAREIIAGAALRPRLEPYGLGPALNQCCGGSVELLFEYLAPPASDWLRALAEAGARGDHAVLASAIEGDRPLHHVALPVGRESDLPEALRAPVRKMLDHAAHDSIEVVSAEGLTWWLQYIAADRRNLLLFGAGHVGKAVVRALADLPFEIRWVDSREQEFPGDIPGNVIPVSTHDPLSEVSSAGPGATYVVMTHSHDLDEDICHAILERGDFAYLGMIGSVSKRRRFAHRLARRGIAEAELERLICPIGLPAIAGKEPATIALSLAAQLMAGHGED